MEEGDKNFGRSTNQRMLVAELSNRDSRLQTVPKALPILAEAGEGGPTGKISLAETRLGSPHGLCIKGHLNAHSGLVAPTPALTETQEVRQHRVFSIQLYSRQLSACCRVCRRLRRFGFVDLLLELW